MSDCFKNLPLWAQDKLYAPPGHKAWKQCRTCHVYKDVAVLKKCGGCSGYRISPMYYCGQECQKQDWQSHKGDCKIIRDRAIEAERSGSGVGNEGEQKLGRMVFHWGEVNSQTVIWAMAHAYYFNSDANPSKVVFDIELDMATFQIISFQFVLKHSPRYKGFFSQAYFSHLQGSDKQWFAISVNRNAGGGPPDYQFNVSWKPLGGDRESITSDIGGPYQEWPWVASHLTCNEEQSVWVATVKWNLLITGVHTLRLKVKGSLDNFKAPKLEVGIPYSPPHMDLWYEKLNSPWIWDHLVACGYVKNTLNRNNGRKYQISLYKRLQNAQI